MERDGDRHLRLSRRCVRDCHGCDGSEHIRQGGSWSAICSAALVSRCSTFHLHSLVRISLNSNLTLVFTRCSSPLSTRCAPAFHMAVSVCSSSSCLFHATSTGPNAVIEIATGEHAYELLTVHDAIRDSHESPTNIAEITSLMVLLNGLLIVNTT